MVYTDFQITRIFLHLSKEALYRLGLCSCLQYLFRSSSPRVLLQGTLFLQAGFLYKQIEKERAAQEGENNADREFRRGNNHS